MTQPAINSDTANHDMEIIVHKGRIVRLSGEGDVIVSPSVQLFDAQGQAMKLVPMLSGTPETAAPAVIAANDNAERFEFEIGDALADGTIYIGEARGAHWATTPEIHSRVANHRDALQLAKDLNAHGHQDWELPNRPVGKKLYDVRNAGKLKGTFDKSEFKGVRQAIWTSEAPLADKADVAWNQWFDVDYQAYDHRSYELSVRPVRRIPGPKPLGAGPG